MSAPIYLDSNATTPLDPAVLEAMLPWLSGEFGNPSSAHRWGRAPREALEDARRRVAAALGASPEQVFFTGGGTESDNLALAGRFAPGRGGRLVVSAIEHPAVLETARVLAGRGIDLEVVPVGPDGRVRPEALRAALARPTDLVSLILANNETGAIQPVAEAAAICREAGALLHTDAVNAAGKIPVDVLALDVDALSLSAHKFHGPKGTGVLYLREPSAFGPLLFGGGQEGGFHPGTPNVAGAVGLAEALERAVAALPAASERMAALSARLVDLVREIRPDARLHVARPEDRLPNTLSICLPGRDSSRLVADLDSAGLAVSAGAACHAGEASASAVLLAMGCSPADARATIRVSSSRCTTAGEIEEAGRILREALSA